MAPIPQGQGAGRRGAVGSSGSSSRSVARKHPFRPGGICWLEGEVLLRMCVLIMFGFTYPFGGVAHLGGDLTFSTVGIPACQWCFGQNELRRIPSGTPFGGGFPPLQREGNPLCVYFCDGFQIDQDEV